MMGWYLFIQSYPLHPLFWISNFRIFLNPKYSKKSQIRGKRGQISRREKADNFFLHRMQSRAKSRGLLLPPCAEPHKETRAPSTVRRAAQRAMGSFHPVESRAKSRGFLLPPRAEPRNPVPPSTLHKLALHLFASHRRTTFFFHHTQSRTWETFLAAICFTLQTHRLLCLHARLQTQSATYFWPPCNANLLETRKPKIELSSWAEPISAWVEPLAPNWAKFQFEPSRVWVVLSREFEPFLSRV